MARYNKVFLGPARKNDAQVEERKTDVATKPGSLAFINGDDEFALHATAGGGGEDQLYIIDHGYLEGLDIDTNIPVGRTAIGHYAKPNAVGIYAVLLAAGQNITAKDIPLASAGGGALRLGVRGTDDILFYSQEAYNNTTGATQLLRVRRA